MLVFIKFNFKNFNYSQQLLNVHYLNKNFISLFKFNFLTISLLELKLIIYLIGHFIIIYNYLNKFIILKSLFIFIDFIIITKLLSFWTFIKYIKSITNLKSNLEFLKSNISTSLIKYKILDIKKISKTTKKGRTKKFKIILVTGNTNSWFGLGVGKDINFNEAVEKAYQNSFNNIYKINVDSLKKIPNLFKIKFKKSNLFFKIGTTFNLKTSILFKSILEISGVKNIKLKIIGSRNKLNSLKAFLKLLKLANDINNKDQTVIDIKNLSNITVLLHLNNILKYSI